LTAQKKDAEEPKAGHVILSEVLQFHYQILFHFFKLRCKINVFQSHEQELLKKNGDDIAKE